MSHLFVVEIVFFSPESADVLEIVFLGEKFTPDEGSRFSISTVDMNLRKSVQIKQCSAIIILITMLISNIPLDNVNYESTVDLPLCVSVSVLVIGRR